MPYRAALMRLAPSCDMQNHLPREADAYKRTNSLLRQFLATNQIMRVAILRAPEDFMWCLAIKADNVIRRRATTSRSWKCMIDRLPCSIELLRLLRWYVSRAEFTTKMCTYCLFNFHTTLSHCCSFNAAHVIS